jgi:hypothetical protein
MDALFCVAGLLLLGPVLRVGLLLVLVPLLGVLLVPGVLLLLVPTDDVVALAG